MDYAKFHLRNPKFRIPKDGRYLPSQMGCRVMRFAHLQLIKLEMYGLELTEESVYLMVSAFVNIPKKMV